MHVGYALVNFRFRTCGFTRVAPDRFALWTGCLVKELFVGCCVEPIFFRWTKIRCAITGNGYLLITENGYLFSLNYRHGAFCGGRLAILELASLWQEESLRIPVQHSGYVVSPPNLPSRPSSSIGRIKRVLKTDKTIVAMMTQLWD
jgi:hypothetical protein